MSPADLAILIVAAMHIAFLVLEMFLWNTSFGRKAFGLTPEFAAQSAKLAANQGLYNGLLGVGLVLSVLAHDFRAQLFLLSFVIVAGLYGGFTVKKSILLIQPLPAVIALVLAHLFR
jgi:putative membrane protein